MHRDRLEKLISLFAKFLMSLYLPHCKSVQWQTHNTRNVKKKKRQQLALNLAAGFPVGGEQFWMPKRQ